VKRWTKILLAIAALVVAAAAAIPLFVHANTFRPAIERQLTRTLGRSVKLGDLRLSVFSRSLVAKELSVADDPNFSAEPFLTAKEARIGVSLRRLIFSHEVELREFEIESPQITVIRDSSGAWNFSSIGRRAAVGAPSSGSAAESGASGTSEGLAAPLPDFHVDRIAVVDGRVVFSTAPAQGQATVSDHVNITARDFAFALQFPFDLSADLPAGGAISVSGRLGPINGADAAATPVEAQITVKSFDPVGAGFIDPEDGLSFLADGDVHSAFDGQTFTTKGTVHIANLKLRKDAASAPKPLDLAYSGTHRVTENSGQIYDTMIKVGDAEIHVSGTYRAMAPGAPSAPSTKGASGAANLEVPLLNLKLSGQNLPIDELQSLMTAAAVRLPNGSKLKGGMLSLNLAITGPPKSLIITGPIAIDNTRLAGFDVSSKIHGIATLSGVKTGDTTEIEKLRANVRVTNGGIVADGIYAVIPDLGELNGNGTVSAANQLDFNLVAKVTSASGIGKVGAGLFSALNGGSGTSSGVPLHITGTPDEPYITANVGGVLKKTTRPITSIFSKKKK
jgi:AsmA protein